MEEVVNLWTRKSRRGWGLLNNFKITNFFFEKMNRIFFIRVILLFTLSGCLLVDNSEKHEGYKTRMDISEKVSSEEEKNVGQKERGVVPQIPNQTSNDCSRAERKYEVIDGELLLGTEKVIGIDISSFKDINCSYYVMDKNGVYYLKKIYNKTDKNFFEAQKIENIDIKTLSIFNEYGDIAKDKNHMYQEGVIIEDADPNTFEEITPEDGYRYWKDKNHVFFMFHEDSGFLSVSIKKVKNADPSTFISIGGGYWKDKDRVYTSLIKFNHRLYVRGIKEVKNADPKTFEYVGNTMSDHGIAKDKNSYYRDGIKEDNIEFCGLIIHDNISASISISGKKEASYSAPVIDVKSLDCLHNLYYFFRDKNSVYIKEGGMLYIMKNIRPEDITEEKNSSAMLKRLDSLEREPMYGCSTKESEEDYSECIFNFAKSRKNSDICYFFRSEKDISKCLNFSGNHNAEKKYQQGLLLLQQKKFSDAEKVFSEIVEKYPEHQKAPKALNEVKKLMKKEQ